MRTFKEKKAAIVGVSIEGLDSARFLAAEGAIVTCCDRRTKEELGETYDVLKNLGVTFQLGQGYLSDLTRFDFVIRTAGMALATPELVDYKKLGGELTSLTKLFFELCTSPIIGVSGTKGKGTTSSLIAKMFEEDGRIVYLGGNVGVPLLSKVRSITPSDWVVLELSSFQLEDLTQSPHIAVVLPITQDHLANVDPLATNYHESREHYVQAKSNIVRFQSKKDIAITNVDNETSRSYGELTPAKKYTVSRTTYDAAGYIKDTSVFVRWDNKVHKICSIDEVRLRGIHNLENIAAASLAAFAAGVSLQSVQKGSKNFQGLPHRLELVGEIGGVSYYNDSFSTVPETTIAAVSSFDEPIVLIVGGSEKGSDFTELGRVVAKESRVSTIIVIGQMTDRIIAALKKFGFSGEIITGLTSMHDIVISAQKHVAPGDIVLLSPACASFDMFKSYKERGAQFVHEVSLITKK